VRTGLTPIPFKITNNLQIDIEDVVKKISTKTIAILITHYFGLVDNNFAELKDLIKKRSIYLIEDCAHTIGGSFQGKNLGTFGDAAIFSIRKFLKIPHGGVLFINNHDLEGINFSSPSKEATEMDKNIFALQQNGFFKPGTPIEEIYHHFDLSISGHHGPRLESFGGYSLGIPESTKKDILSFDWEEEFEKRKARLSKLVKLFREQDKQLFTPLIKDINNTYLNFPVLLNQGSDLFIRQLRENSCYEGQPFWSYLHKYFNWEQFPDAKKLKENMISFPLNKDINIINLKKAIELSAKKL